MLRRNSLRAISAFFLFSLLFACTKENDFTPTSLNEDGLAIPQTRQIVLPVEVKNGLVAFNDTKSFKEAILTLQEYNQDEIDNWTASLPITTLYAKKLEVEENGTAGIPEAIVDYFYGDAPYGGKTLTGVNQSMSMFLDQDGLITIGDRISFVTRFYQVSTSLDRVEEFRNAIRSGSPLEAFDVNLDGRHFMPSNTLDQRADRFVSVECGRLELSRVYSYMHRRGSKRNQRNHAMYFDLDMYAEPVNTDSNPGCPIFGDCGPTGDPAQSVAWQSVALRSISYKKPNNKYNTRHNLSWDILWTNDGAGSFNQTHKTSPWGKDIERILFLTGPQGTDNEIDPTIFTMSEVRPGSGDNLSSDGTWGTHRGMGDDHKIRWTCD